MNSLFQKNLLVLIIFTQVILWLSYKIILPKYKTSVFWGRIPKSSWNEFLIFAAIAYILNLLLYFYFVFKKNVNDKTVFKVIITLLAYYGLQYFFLPIVLTKNRTWIKLLLGICVIPLVYLAYLAYKQSEKTNNIYEKIFLVGTSLLPFLHVFINDFIRYGFGF